MNERQINQYFLKQIFWFESAVSVEKGVDVFLFKILYNLGSLSGASKQVSSTLQEAYLRENKLYKPFSPVVTKKRKLCPNDLVCTTRITPGANNCFGDEGNPLYAFNPCFNKTHTAYCLYGVALYHETKIGGPEVDCDDGSYFARVSTVQSWISCVLYQEMPSIELCILS